MIIPAAYYFSQDGGMFQVFASQFLRLIVRQDSAKPGLLIISRGTAILLLFIYLAYLWFQA